MKKYDYSTPNYYFITVCTKWKKCIFGTVNERNTLGRIAEKAMMEIPEHYSGVHVDKFVIMPNHVHGIIILRGGKSKLDKVIGSFKSYVTKKAHEKNPDQEVWQASFHDHIIRNQQEYQRIWLYIDSNPQNWEKDCFYCE